MTGVAVERWLFATMRGRRAWLLLIDCIWRIADSEGRPSHFAILNAMVWPSGDSKTGMFFTVVSRCCSRGGDRSHSHSLHHLGDEALWWGDCVAVRTNNASFGQSG